MDERAFRYALAGSYGKDFNSGDYETRGEAVAAALKEIAEEDMKIRTFFVARGETYYDPDDVDHQTLKHRIVDIEAVAVLQGEAPAQ
jgi:hypothetical protein